VFVIIGVSLKHNRALDPPLVLMASNLLVLEVITQEADCFSRVVWCPLTGYGAGLSKYVSFTPLPNKKVTVDLASFGIAYILLLCVYNPINMYFEGDLASTSGPNVETSSSGKYITHFICDLLFVSCFSAMVGVYYHCMDCRMGYMAFYT
jgi:hypothetical protein